MPRCAFLRRADLHAGQGETLRLYRLARRLFSCPHCGRLHRERLPPLWFSALLAVVLVFLTATGVRAEREASRSGERSQLVRAHSLAGKPAKILPEPAPPREPDLPSMNAQTQVEVPATAVVWNRAGAGTYVWDRPDGEITSFLENGLVVELLENWAVHGGVPFGEMQHDGQSGWLDMRHVHRLVLPASGFNRVSSTAGANLYAQPGGAVLTWLSPGTPLIETGNTAGVPSAEWVAVALLVGGQSGWVNHNALDNPGR